MNTETQAQNQKKSRDLEKGALWLKKSKAGTDFLSGYFLDSNQEKVNIVVFKNGFKKPGEPSPDYRVYLSEKAQTQDQQPSPVSKKNTPAPSDDASGSNESEDIPF